MSGAWCIMLFALAHGFLAPTPLRRAPPGVVVASGTSSPGSPQQQQQHQQQQQTTDKAANDVVVADLMEAARRLREEASEMEAQLRRDAASELDEFFDIADTNRDGRVTLDELRVALRLKLVDGANARDAARAERLLSDARIAHVMRDLDRDNDGSIERDEWVSVPEFRDRLEQIFREEEEEEEEEGTVHAAVLANRRILERIELFEKQTNQTGLAARLAAVACYLVPALDLAMLPIYKVPVLSPLLVQAAAVYHNVPFSGVLALFVVFNIAIDFKVPRLVRWAARHALIVDLLAIFTLPPAVHALGPEVGALLPTLLEALVLVCAVSALNGNSATWVPLTGQLATKFTDDCDQQIKQTIEEVAYKQAYANATAQKSPRLDSTRAVPERKTVFEKLLDAFYKQAGIDRPVQATTKDTDDDDNDAAAAAAKKAKPKSSHHKDEEEFEDDDYSEI
ncbi:hypothetical protein CTAYLR_005279 [Chrysophaeum taylorii]|uniref:EF-hand domain-containing protein n=1 Tax=Chrysophaeum taylorii TaxID=2483200 RepID=A0AAD7XPN1_9STRA|nr:hypothetical protein CTAYLR_005279 [Chrysophaeum taylorii]